MNRNFKIFLRPFIPHTVIVLVGKILIKKWEKEGSPIPPPHVVKQKTIQEYHERFGNSILIETGTFKGDMVEAQKRRFRKVYSIELGQELFEAAKKRFKKDKNVKIIHGDSGNVLKSLMGEIDSPAIFWLDGHYSAGVTAKGDKECPIFEELDAILNGSKLNHVLLIDDARCFVGENDYPTIQDLTNYISNRVDQFQFEVKYDVIRVVL